MVEIKHVGKRYLGQCSLNGLTEITHAQQSVANEITRATQINTKEVACCRQNTAQITERRQIT